MLWWIFFQNENRDSSRHVSLELETVVFDKKKKTCFQQASKCWEYFDFFFLHHNARLKSDTLLYLTKSMRSDYISFLLRAIVFSQRFLHALSRLAIIQKNNLRLFPTPRYKLFDKSLRPKRISRLTTIKYIVLKLILLRIGKVTNFKKWNS